MRGFGPSPFSLFVVPVKSATLSVMLCDCGTVSLWHRNSRFPSPEATVPLQLRGHTAVSGDGSSEDEHGNIKIHFNKLCGLCYILLTAVENKILNVQNRKFCLWKAAQTWHTKEESLKCIFSLSLSVWSSWDRDKLSYFPKTLKSWTKKYLKSKTWKGNHKDSSGGLNRNCKNGRRWFSSNSQFLHGARRGIHYHAHSADLILFKINCQFSFGCPRRLTGFEFSHELDLGRVIWETRAKTGLRGVGTCWVSVCFPNPNKH